MAVAACIVDPMIFQPAKYVKPELADWVANRTSPSTKRAWRPRKTASGHREIPALRWDSIRASLKSEGASYRF